MDMVTHKKHNETGARNSLIYTEHICSKIDNSLNIPDTPILNPHVAVRYFRENMVV